MNVNNKSGFSLLDQFHKEFLKSDGTLDNDLFVRKIRDEEISRGNEDAMLEAITDNLIDKLPFRLQMK